MATSSKRKEVMNSLRLAIAPLVLGSHATLLKAIDGLKELKQYAMLHEKELKSMLPRLDSLMSAMTAASDATQSIAGTALDALEPLDKFDPKEWVPEVMDPLASSDWTKVRPMTREDALGAVGFSKSRVHAFERNVMTVPVTEWPPDDVDPWERKGAMIGPYDGVDELEHGTNAVYLDEDGQFWMITYSGESQPIVASTFAASSTVNYTISGRGGDGSGQGGTA